MPVKPLLRLQIEPHDFPYLPYVKGLRRDTMVQRIKSGMDGGPWLDDPEVFPISPDIPKNIRADQAQLMIDL